MEKLFLAKLLRVFLWIIIIFDVVGFGSFRWIKMMIMMMDHYMHEHNNKRKKKNLFNENIFSNKTDSNEKPEKIRTNKKNLVTKKTNSI